MSSKLQSISYLFSRFKISKILCCEFGGETVATMKFSLKSDEAITIQSYVNADFEAVEFILIKLL